MGGQRRPKSSTRDRLRRKVGKCSVAEEVTKTKIDEVTRSLAKNPQQALGKINTSALKKASKMIETGEGLPEGLSLDVLQNCLGAQEQEQAPPENTETPGGGEQLSENIIPATQDESPPPEHDADDEDFYESVFLAQAAKMTSSGAPENHETQSLLWTGNKFVERKYIDGKWTYSVKVFQFQEK